MSAERNIKKIYYTTVVRGGGVKWSLSPLQDLPSTIRTHFVIALRVRSELNTDMSAIIILLDIENFVWLMRIADCETKNNNYINDDCIKTILRSTRNSSCIRDYTSNVPYRNGMEKAKTTGTLIRSEFYDDFEQRITRKKNHKRKLV